MKIPGWSIRQGTFRKRRDGASPFLIFGPAKCQSFAELGEEVKNKLSHRAKALAGLRARLVNR